MSPAKSLSASTAVSSCCTLSFFSQSRINSNTLVRNCSAVIRFPLTVSRNIASSALLPNRGRSARSETDSIHHREPSIRDILHRIRYGHADCGNLHTRTRLSQSADPQTLLAAYASLACLLTHLRHWPS